MAKSKDTKVEASINGKEIDITKLLENKHPINITSGAIKDDYCHYGYKITEGPGAGDEIPTRKGAGIVMDDLKKAFDAFNVHAAIIDDVFKHTGKSTDDISDLACDEITELYKITGFKISGHSDNESISLIGSKYVSNAIGRMPIDTPKVVISEGSTYKWYNELKAAADLVRREVELYMNGKYIREADLLPEANPDQTSLMNEEEFEGAKV